MVILFFVVSDETGTICTEKCAWLDVADACMTFVVGGLWYNLAILLSSKLLLLIIMIG